MFSVLILVIALLLKFISLATKKQNLYHFHTDLNDFFFHLYYLTFKQKDFSTNFHYSNKESRDGQQKLYEYYKKYSNLR